MGSSRFDNQLSIAATLEALLCHGNKKLILIDCWRSVGSCGYQNNSKLFQKTKKNAEKFLR